MTPFVFLAVTLPKHLQILPSSPSKPSRRSMQSPYRLPNPLPPLPVRKGVRGRRPKSETIALLKAVAEAAAAQNGSVPENTQLVPRVHKKRGPKPGSKVRPSFDCLICYQPHIFIKFSLLQHTQIQKPIREQLVGKNSCMTIQFERYHLLV